MRKIVILLSILLLSLCLSMSGCGSKTAAPAEVEPIIGPGEQPAEQETPVAEPAAPEEDAKDEPEQDTELPVETKMPEITSESESEIIAQLNPQNKFIVRPYSQDAQVGDTLVYAVGIYNTNPEPAYFKLIDTQFLDATDYMNNRITLQDDTIDKWIITGNLPDLEIAAYSYTIVPVYIKVLEKATGSEETMPGRYRFNIQVYKYNDREHIEKEKYADKDFFVRIPQE